MKEASYSVAEMLHAQFDPNEMSDFRSDLPARKRRRTSEGSMDSSHLSGRSESAAYGAKSLDSSMMPARLYVNHMCM